ncbi:MAG: hypothetical protein ONB53_21795 [candidate division KSB1 bacterium]|nr:hypothetical protein [candidate division KSB1 bacterium]MDZ7300464.1 hypothetical protein [candidate division KSB1 bacterium]MDZ7308642.1 hypothetical protein [candidate division KSB1 bacterium]MDZ7351434.1 hypothetical protein [candidate division KSB1 bacterium]MDZ7355793.1 hypothetical protein [candidate division KSB1 bacterium]
MATPGSGLGLGLALLVMIKHKFLFCTGQFLPAQIIDAWHRNVLSCSSGIADQHMLKHFGLIPVPSRDARGTRLISANL